MSHPSGGPPRLAVVAKPSAAQLPRVLSQLVPEFFARGWAVHSDDSILGAWTAAGLPEDRLATAMPDKCDLALVLGGDGTMLRAGRQLGLDGIPLLGINLGYLGFLTIHTADRAQETLQKYFAGRLTEDRRRALHVSVMRGDVELASFDAINDAVITKGALSRILGLELAIDRGLAVSIRADGLIVATPSGSTAYALSAGGPIVHPSLEAWTIAPICPHSLNMRPSVVPADLVVGVRLCQAEEAHLTIDGQVGSPMQPGDLVEMSDSGRHATLLLDPEVPYFSILREKMHWFRGRE